MKNLYALLLVFALCPCLHAKSERLRIAWFNDPATQAMVCWDQVSGANPVLYYDTVKRGENLKAYAHQQKPTAQNDYHDMNNTFAALKNLKPDTNYYCCLSDDEGKAKRFWFKTAPNTPKAFSFAAGGDTKSEPGTRDRGRLTNTFVPKVQPLFVIYAGDFTSGNGLNATYWKNWLSDWEEDTTTKDGRIFPIVPVRGNHEEHEDILYKIFNMDNNLCYFALNVGGDLFRFYALNSEINIKNPATRGNRGKNSPDLKKHTAWLEQDLKAHPNTRFKVASFHKPFRPHTRRTSENDYIAKPWTPLFERYGMDAAIEGDSHMTKITHPVRMSNEAGSDEGFIRDDAKGTVYMGEGSWGAGTRATDDDKDWTLASGKFAQFKWVHVHPEAMKIYTIITEKPAPDMDDVDPTAPLKIPAGTPLFDNKGHGTAVKVPYRKR